MKKLFHFTTKLVQFYSNTPPFFVTPCSHFLQIIVHSRQIKPQFTRLLTFSQQPVMNRTSLIAQIIKILVPPLKFLHRAWKIRHHVRIRGETFDGTGRKANPLLGADRRDEFVDNVLDELSVFRSGLAYRFAVFGRSYEHVSGDPNQLFKHSRSVFLGRNDIALQTQIGQSIRKCLSMKSSRGSQPFGIDGGYSIDGFDSLGGDAEVEEGLGVGEEIFASQEVIKVSILQKHQILSPLLGTSFYNTLQNIIPRGNVNGTFSIGIDRIGNGIISTEKFGVFGNEGSDSSSPDYDCSVIIVVGGNWQGRQRRR
mmetsp:Transcript_11702/g.24076  ORF Transcript_11702/g.24076 Transcript_11702/m.24076 type:complete len:311 (+) Transcript_11702:140-1072(+)